MPRSLGLRGINRKERSKLRGEFTPGEIKVQGGA